MRFRLLPRSRPPAPRPGCGCDDDKGSEAEATPEATATAPERRPPPAARRSTPESKGDGKLGKPTESLDPSKTYVATVVTSCGSFEIQLDVKRAPKTAASFAYLAEEASSTRPRSTGSSPAS